MEGVQRRIPLHPSPFRKHIRAVFSFQAIIHGIPESPSLKLKTRVQQKPDFRKQLEHTGFRSSVCFSALRQLKYRAPGLNSGLHLMTRRSKDPAFQFTHIHNIRPLDIHYLEQASVNLAFSSSGRNTTARLHRICLQFHSHRLLTSPSALAVQQGKRRSTRSCKAPAKTKLKKRYIYL